MKLVSLFACVALAAVAALVLGIVFDAQPLALFGVAASALMLLVAVGDYAPRTTRMRTRLADVVPFASASKSAESSTDLAA